MSQAEDLLNTLSETGEEHTHPVVDSDTYFIIDPITRKIENTAREKNTLMQYDHDSEVFTFELARYVEGHDMTLCNVVKVHWNNIDGTTGQENADVTDLYDLRINPDKPDTVICSWKISRQATQLAGILSFLVQYLCELDDGTVTYEWHSDIYSDIEIKPGRNNGAAAVINYSDILEQWRVRLFGAGNSVIANIEEVGQLQVETIQQEAVTQKSAIEAKGVETLATIPEDYTTTYNMAEEALRRKANAIELDAAGEAIFVDNASDNYLLGLKVYGRSEQVKTTGAQLWNSSDTDGQTLQGVTMKCTNGEYILNGTCEVSSNFLIGRMSIEDGTYTLAANNPKHNSNNQALVQVYSPTTNDGLACLDTSVNAIETYEMTASDDYELRIRIEAGIIYNNFRLKPMLNIGDTALPWEPYTGGKISPSIEYPQEVMSVENPTIYINGKNLFNMDAIEDTSTITKQNDGTISVTQYYNSTSKTLKTLCPGLVVGARCVLTIDTDGATFIYLTKLGAVWDTGAVHTITQDMLDSHVCIYGKYDQTEGSTIIGSIQIRLIDSSTDYESYIESQSFTVPHILRGFAVETDGNVIDSSGQQWIADYVDYEKKELVQHVGVYTFDGSDDENWLYDATKKLFQLSYLNLNKTWNVVMNTDKSYMTHFRYDEGVWNSTTAEYGYCINFNSLFVRCGSVSSLESFKTLLANNPIEFIHILPEPTTIPLTDDEILAYKALKTNYFNTTVLNDYSAYMEMDYAADTEIYLRDNQPVPTDDQVTNAVNAYLDQSGVQVPSDDHINELINSALGVIENGSY